MSNLNIGNYKLESPHVMQKHIRKAGAPENNVGVLLNG